MRAGIAYVVALLGGWLTVPCALLAHFAYTGSGGDRDGGGRGLATTGYLAMAVACFAVSVLLVRWLAPQVLGRALGAYAVGIVLGVVMLGIFA